MALLGIVGAGFNATAAFALVVLPVRVLTYPSMASNSSTPRRALTRRTVLIKVSQLRGHAACVRSAQKSR
jgi:hypothetical protein